jgi:cytochrome c oxidase assembly factor CtaG
MTDKPRYSMRENSAALTRVQWWIVGVAFFVAAVGAVLALAGRTPFGTMLMSLSALTAAFTGVIAKGQGPSK